MSLRARRPRPLDAIEDKLGLSFEQFRRSALLAQNDFAAFLRRRREAALGSARANDGPPISTTKVSIAAFRKAVAEAKILSDLQESTDASLILDDDSRAAPGRQTSHLAGAAKGDAGRSPNRTHIDAVVHRGQGSDSGCRRGALGKEHRARGRGGSVTFGVADRRQFAKRVTREVLSTPIEMLVNRLL